MAGNHERASLRRRPANHYWAVQGIHLYEFAELITPGGIATSVLPPLYEPVLAGIAPLAIVLRGFERMKEPEGNYSEIQEWHCEMP